MSLVLDATIAGANSNSYVTRAEANAYFDGRVDASAWTALPDVDGGARDQALVAATSRLDQEQYEGQRSQYITRQRLKWPRTDTYDDDGYLYAWDSIPRQVQEATFEMALWLLQNPSSLTSNPLNQFASIAVSGLTILPREAETNQHLLPPQVIRCLRGLRLGGSGQPRLIRG